MAYIGIGYSGQDGSFLRNQVQQHLSWLQGDRRPYFFGDGFVVLYDSNTAREFAKKCAAAAHAADDTGAGDISVYTMDHPLPQEHA